MSPILPRQAFLLLLLIPGLGLAQDQIEWSDTVTLRPSDFRATSPNTGIMQTIRGHITVGYQMAGYETMFSKNYNKNVSCFFQRSASWLDSGVYTSELIRYANTIFDLDEWMARELRKRFRENRSKMAKGQADVIYTQLQKEFAELEALYSKETDFGKKAIEQAEWERKITASLLMLKDYCKTCKPPKGK